MLHHVSWISGIKNYTIAMIIMVIRYLFII